MDNSLEAIFAEEELLSKNYYSEQAASILKELSSVHRQLLWAGVKHCKAGKSPNKSQKL